MQLDTNILGNLFALTLRAVRFLALLTLLSSKPLLAQEIRLSSPLQERSYAEGHDFASIELDNAWDFAQRRDIGFEVGYYGNSVEVSNGIWSAINEKAGAYVFPLFGGYSDSLFAEGLPGDRSLPRFGANHPIEASRYYYLSFRSRSSATSTIAIYWNTDAQRNLFPDGSERGASYSGYYYAGAQQNSDFEVRSYDLRSQAFEQNSGNWQNKVYALRIDPSVFAPAGSKSEFDWIRLVDPNSAPMIDVEWELENAPQSALITVYLDTNAGGYQGTPIARFINGASPRSPSSSLYNAHPTPLSNTNRFSYPSAALPPGTYYFYLAIDVFSGGDLRRISQSSYSAPINILAAPSGYFSSPSPDSGQDYASTEIGDAWDMQELSDVKNALPGSLPQELRQFSNAGTLNGVFQATADPPLPGNSESDSQVLMNIPSNLQIDTTKYRYLTYRMAADPTMYPSIEDKVRDGWVTRPVFWNSNLFERGGSFKAHILYEGFHTYTIDLWDNSQLEWGLAWKDIGRISSLRVDPLETSLPTWFFLDNVSLSAENKPHNDNYRITWFLEDLDSTQLSYELYLDNNDYGFDGSLIFTKSLANLGENYFDLSTQSLAPGRYFPHIKITDGASSRSFYSKTPIVVGGAELEWLAKPFDYDGDGLSDPSVYRPGMQGMFFIKSSQNGNYSRSWGLSGYHPIEGDFDGDRKSDIAVVANINSALHWFVIRSSDGGLYYRIWGKSGDIPVVADFDGNACDEIAIFRQGAWYVLDENGGASVSHWGASGDYPIAADYDGDGLDDFAIWRPSDGTWWVVNSGFEKGKSLNKYSVVQWGLSGDIPLSADFDGDKKVDQVVWRPSTASWFVRLSNGLSTRVVQWGLPGDVPIIGNFISSSQPSLSVWRSQTGQWFHKSLSGETKIEQWGLMNDLPISKRSAAVN